eukprot:Gb_40898 [translate_table: standard]
MAISLLMGQGNQRRDVIITDYTMRDAAAYYYHGLILDEGNEDNNHAKAVACLQVAEQYLEDSKRACSDFCVAVPVTRVPPLWGAMKFLSENIPKDASSKSRTYRDVYSHEKWGRGKC